MCELTLFENRVCTDVTKLGRGHINFPGGSGSTASAYNVGDPGSIPGLGRSPGEGNGNPLQSSCLENPMDGGTLQSMGSQRVGHNLVTSLHICT